MVSLYLGITAFVLYLIYDINSFTWQCAAFHSCFFLGTGLLAVATGWDLWSAWRLGAFSGTIDAILLTITLVFFVALIYSLFFALPFKQTYTEQGGCRRVYRCGVYALCRHPGILCFFGMYVAMGFAALPTHMIIHSLIFSLLNLLYAWFQDCVTFPKTFCDYSDYKKQVPFLIPTGDSIAMAQKTLSAVHDEEDAP